MRIIVGFQAEGTPPHQIHSLRVTVPSGSTIQTRKKVGGAVLVGGGGGGGSTSPAQSPRVTHFVIEEGEDDEREEEVEEAEGGEDDEEDEGEDHLADDDDGPHHLKKNEMGECSLAIIDHGLTRLFYWLGVKIGQNPSYFLIIPFFMALLLGTGMQRLNYVDDPEYLFSPVDGAAKTERLIVEELFPMNYTHRFHPSRFVRPGRFAR